MIAAAGPQGPLGVVAIWDRHFSGVKVTMNTPVSLGCLLGLAQCRHGRSIPFQLLLHRLLLLPRLLPAKRHGAAVADEVLAVEAAELQRARLR